MLICLLNVHYMKIRISFPINGVKPKVSKWRKKEESKSVLHAITTAGCSTRRLCRKFHRGIDDYFRS